MPAKPPQRQKPGRQPSKLERDTSKKNVALAKADRERKMAVKAFATRQKELKKQLSVLEPLTKKLKDNLEALERDRDLEARFLNQVLKQVKLLTNAEKTFKQDAAQFAEIVDKPKVYQEVLVRARDIPKPANISGAPSLLMALGLLVVILKRLVQLKAK